MFPVCRDPDMENQWALANGSSGGSQTERQWAVSVIVCGSLREELSPAQTEPTNAISVSNTIVLFSQANAIILSPVLRAHSPHKPQSQTFGPTLRLIFDVDKTHTIALSPMWPDQREGGPIVAFCELA